MNHQKPDRIPRYEIFLQGYIEAWQRAKGMGDSADIYSYYPEIDIGRILATQEGPFLRLHHIEQTDRDLYLEHDSWGRLKRRSRTGVFFEVVETAIKEKSDLDKLEFEDPQDPARYASFVDPVRSVDRADANKGSRERFALVSGVMGLFMSSYYLRGELSLLMDLAEDEIFCQALARKVADFLTVVGENALKYTHTWDTALWVYDELGNNKSAIMSPRIFQQVYLQPYRRMISDWKSKGAKQVILHCDGNCLPLLDLLLDAGFTGIQGVNPTAGMTVPAVKAKYGRRLNLIGGMCNIQVLARGTKREIENQAKSIVEAAKDGGVIIGTHSIDSDIPVENYDYYVGVLEKLDRSW